MIESITHYTAYFHIIQAEQAIYAVAIISIPSIEYWTKPSNDKNQCWFDPTTMYVTSTWSPKEALHPYEGYENN